MTAQIATIRLMIYSSIQPASRKHQKAIKDLIREVGINPMGLKWQRFLVALDKAENVIGCGQVKPHRDGSRELASIAVVHQWRNQGVAKAIIQELVELQPLPLWLTCMSRLIPFYEQFGFVEVAETREMPPYFRWSVRLFPIYRRLASVDGYLAVMALHEDGSI